MSVLGCHNCEHFGKFNGMEYKDTPCASCKLTKESRNTGKRGALFDSDAQTDCEDEIEAMDVASEEETQTIPDNIPQYVIELIKEACQSNMMVVLSNLILILVKLAKENPPIFSVLMMKMQHPSMSYYEIGRMLNPPCSKQNVLYHLKRVVSMYPELESAIITDTRFSGGRYAIRTTADIARHNRLVEDVRQQLYPQTKVNQSFSIDDLNRLLNLPYAKETALDTDYREKQEV